MEVSDMACITSVPSEVLENIFRFLSGHSFCVARQVCKTWNVIIKSMQVKRSIWKQFCLREISQNVLQEILWFKDMSTDIDWMSVYKKWFQSKMIVTSPFLKRKICALFPNPNPITCIAMSGSWVLTGHSNGLICIWNLYTSDLHQNSLSHLKAISDIALVDLLSLGSYYGAEDHPWQHHHVITISKDRYIHIVPLLEPLKFTDTDIHLCPHGDDLKQVVVYGDTFAVSCRDNTVSLWKMQVHKKPYFHLTASLLQMVVGPADILFSIGLWKNQLQCVSNSGKLKTIDPGEGDWVEKKYFKESYTECRVEAIVSVTVAYLFRSKTVIMLTADGKLIISVNEKCNVHYYLMRTLRTSLVSIALHGTILALGGENGKLFLFHVPSEDDLMTLDLSNPDVTLSLSEASIISIAISDEHDSPAIVASTTDIIYTIKWYKHKLCHQEVRKRVVLNNSYLKSF